MIPKKIHYCWFGGNPLPALEQKCIASWKKYCPDYEIIEWNEHNFDITCCDYVSEAYAAQKWAFVSDYARFWILYHEGGIYFDTDVEIIRPIDDIVARGPFFGTEHNIAEALGSGNARVAPGLGAAAEAGHRFYRELLDFYEARHFRKPDHTFDTTTVVVYTTDLLRKYGFTTSSDIQCVNGIYIYPTEYFCPLNYQTLKMKITDNTRSIHHYTASWQAKTVLSRVKKWLRLLLGPKLTQYILYCKHKLRQMKSWSL